MIGAALGAGTTSRTWRARLGRDRYVLKVTADHARFVVPGLAVAAELARRGVRAGPPLPAADGSLAVETVVDGRPSTVGLLHFEPGDPVDMSTESGVVTAADLLATVHTRVRQAPMPDVPNRLFDWFGEFLPDGHPAHDALRAVRAAEPGLTAGVVYGDPAPEVLVDGSVAGAALIDWGTPSHGPLAYDVAVWANWAARENSRAGDAEVFVSAYRQRRALTEPEQDMLSTLRTLAATTIGPALR